MRWGRGEPHPYATDTLPSSLLQASQQLAGVDGIQYFLLFILAESGVVGRSAQFGALLALGVLKLACIFVAARYFDGAGRRPLLLGSCAGCGVALCVLAAHFAAGAGASPPAVAVGALALYLAAFSIGLGPGSWLVPSEVVRCSAMQCTTIQCNV